MLYATAPSDAPRPWFEQTSVLQWNGLTRVAQRFNISIDFRVLHLVRATLVYEMLALRLDPSVGIVRRYRRFLRDRSVHAAKRASREAARRVGKSFRKTIYLRLERLAATGEGLFFRLRHALALPRVNFNSMISKGSFTFVTFVKLATQVLLLMALLAGFRVTRSYLADHQAVPYRIAVREAVSTGLFQACVVVLMFINGRPLLFRLDDEDA